MLLHHEVAVPGVPNVSSKKLAIASAAGSIRAGSS
jgi:hypothetical protein